MAAPHGTADAALLFIVGADRADQVARIGTKVRLGGSTDLHKLLDKFEPHHRLHVTKHYFRQARRPELAQYSCFFNMITEPEQNARVLDNLRKLLRGLPGKVVNRPEAVLRSTRDQVAKLLADIPGLIVPKVIRLKGGRAEISVRAIERAGLTVPIILREAGTHTGRIVGCFDTIDAMRPELNAGGDFIATEFHDFRSRDGHYRKYRVFFIGRHLIFRHMLASDRWNVHAEDRARFMTQRQELLDEEQALFTKPQGAFPPDVSETLALVREKMTLDYFGMDFGITADHRVVLFEANATMNFFPFLSDPRFAYVQSCLEPAQRAFRELIGRMPAS